MQAVHASEIASKRFLEDLRRSNQNSFSSGDLVASRQQEFEKQEVYLDTYYANAMLSLKDKVGADCFRTFVDDILSIRTGKDSRHSPANAAEDSRYAPPVRLKTLGVRSKNDLENGPIAAKYVVARKHRRVHHSKVHSEHNKSLSIKQSKSERGSVIGGRVGTPYYHSMLQQLLTEAAGMNEKCRLQHSCGEQMATSS